MMGNMMQNGMGGGGGYGPMSGKAQPPPQSKNVFVGNLPIGIDEAQAVALFSKYDQIATIKILEGNSTNGACILSFATEEEAQGLVNENGKTLEGLQRPIKAVF